VVSSLSEEPAVSILRDMELAGHSEIYVTG
jgi:hypothetical protein